MVFSVMLTDAFHDCDAALPIRYRFDGYLFILRMLEAKPKAKSEVQTDVLNKLLDADDMAKKAQNRE